LIVSNRRRALLLLASLGLVLPLLVTQVANAASPAPVRIQIDKISSDIAAPPGTPQSSQPTVLVQVGGVIHIDVSFYDADGNPASFNTDTKMSIDSSAGTPSPSTVVVPKNNESWTLDTSLSTAANQVSLTVSVAGGKGARTVTPGSSSANQLFDVVSELRTEPSTENFAQGIGGDTNCTEATRQSPVCGIVILPKGAASDVLLSAGACDTTAYAKCSSTKGSVIQTLFADGGLYSPVAPATLLLKCDKTLCGGGSIQGVHVNFSLTGNGALDQAPPCPSKDTVGDGQQACVDYVQSKRDGAGDTYLYVLFTQDIRLSM
jgi:hypothetical protein